MINENEPHLREICQADFSGLVELFQKNNIKKITKQFNPFPLTEETAYQITHIDSLDKYYISSFNGKIIGLGMLRGWDEGFLLPSLGVLIDKDYQGTGLGEKMTKLLIEEAKRLGCTRIRLTVYASNKVALNLYNSAGFQEVNRTPVCVLGEQDEKILMYKELKDSQ